MRHPNVCFKKTKTIPSSDTLLQFVLLFLKQTLYRSACIERNPFWCCLQIRHVLVWLLCDGKKPSCFGFWCLEMTEFLNEIFDYGSQWRPLVTNSVLNFSFNITLELCSNYVFSTFVPYHGTFFMSGNTQNHLQYIVRLIDK